MQQESLIPRHPQVKSLRLILYGTSGCHLCEEAAEVLLAFSESTGLCLVVDGIDIADDADLLARYGTRIPVLVKPASDADLGWPFDKEALSAFLADG